VSCARSLAALLHNVGKTKTEEQAAPDGGNWESCFGFVVGEARFLGRDPFLYVTQILGLVFAFLPLETV